MQKLRKSRWIAAFFFYVVNFERHIIPDRWQSIRSFPLSCQDAVKWGRDSKPIQSLNHLMVSQFSLPSMNHRLTSPIGFLSLKLPPPACAVLLVVDAGSSRLPLGPRRSVASAFWKLRKPSNIHNIPDILTYQDVKSVCEFHFGAQFWHSEGHWCSLWTSRRGALLPCWCQSPNPSAERAKDFCGFPEPQRHTFLLHVGKRKKVETLLAKPSQTLAMKSSQFLSLIFAASPGTGNVLLKSGSWSKHLQTLLQRVHAIAHGFLLCLLFTFTYMHSWHNRNSQTFLMSKFTACHVKQHFFNRIMVLFASSFLLQGKVRIDHAPFFPCPLSVSLCLSLSLYADTNCLHLRGVCILILACLWHSDAMH